MHMQKAQPESVASVRALLDDLRPFVQNLLEKLIDRTNPNWWGLYVDQTFYPKPVHKSERELGALDLPSLLKILTKKWPDFHKALGMPWHHNGTIFTLIQIRNDYSHVDEELPTDLDVLVALHGIHAFAKEFLAPQAIRDMAAKEIEAAVARLNDKTKVPESPRADKDAFSVQELMENLRKVLKEIEQDHTPLAKEVEVKCIDTKNALPLTEALKGKTPKGISIQQRLYGANSWKEVYERLLEDLVKVNQPLFEQLPENPDFRGKGDARFFTVQGDRKRLRAPSKSFAPTKVKAELFIGTADFYDPKKRVPKLLKHFGIPAEDVLVLVSNEGPRDESGF